jgi:hypothetical protein
MGSGYAGVYEAYRGRKNSEGQARDAKKKEENRQSAIDANIAKVREMFGVVPYDDIGDRPTRESMGISVMTEQQQRRLNAAQADWDSKKAQNPKALENKAKLDSWLDDYSGAVLDANNMDLNDQFMATNTSNRWALSDRGLLGGSVDAGAQRRQISELVAGRQKAVMASRDARRNAQGSLVNQRLNLEQQMATGTQLNPDFDAFQQQTQMGLDQVRSNIAPTAVGNTFTTLGQGAGAAIAQPGRSPRTPTAANVSGSSAGTISRGG